MSTVTGERETYFFLSYAHSVPLSEKARPDTDYWVKRFFQDLSAAVAAHPQRNEELATGFFDGSLPAGADLRPLLTAALGAAHVFVPLYSKNYFGNSWATGELDAFRARLADARAPDAEQHIVPVLWSPLDSWDDRAREVAAALAVVEEDAPERADYEQNGLRALCALGPYRTQYGRIVRAVAERVVGVTRDHQLPRSEAPPVITPRATDPRDARLIVAVLTGDKGAGWRPFPTEHELALADYVAAVADRLSMPAAVLDLAGVAEWSPVKPTVLLVDPSFGAQAARAAVEALPRWVVPLVVVGEDQRGAADAETVATTLQDAGLPKVLPARTATEFERTVPILVTEADKQFLRHGPVNPPAGPVTPRPSLRPGTASDDGQGQGDAR
ncbi:TIR-like protein FxsC [Dactylosporangium sp. AC04546]|uniref:TIR-like protein FxsC n=1 Tax=Dactylosporangium sp. AC04546 TaxID=2862460 RepID=UPI001EDFAC06|nr:TIR-like protein FxsC [Dactylosporangium sp. AC04546]WVK84140.1 TIR-like protein FxsC [Dactylosporangium sp. AC04546]